jgi:hypothetical protein
VASDPTVSWDRRRLPASTRTPTRSKPDAIAIDERRAKFRTNRVTPKTGVPQDVQEVWFAGVHADVGGGYPEKESGLAKVTLQWMLREAEKQELLLDLAVKNQLLHGPVVGPDELAGQHESLKGMWWPLEYLRLPHRKLANGQWIEGMIRYRGKGWRTIRSGDLVHRSIQRRIAKRPLKNANWPAAQSGVAWVD